MLFLRELRVVLLLGAAVLSLGSEAAKLPLNIKCTTDVCLQEGTSITVSGNFSLDPCDDFYEFACANFDLLNPLPAGRFLWDNYQILQNTSDHITRELLSSPVEDGAPVAVDKVTQMFAACMDTKSLDERGLDPLVSVIDQLGGWPLIDPSWESNMEWQELGQVIADYGVPMIFEIVVRTNLLNANKTLLYIDPPALTLPVPLVGEPPETMEEILSHPSKGSDSAYTLFIHKIAMHLRDHLGSDVSNDDILQDVREVIAFMGDLFRAKFVPGQNPSEVPTSGEMTFAQLQEWTDELPENVMKVNWVDFMNTVYSNTDVTLTSEDSIFIFNLPALGRIMTLFSNTEPRVRANFVISRLMAFMSPESDEYMRNTSDWFFQAQKYIPPDYERWRYCVHKVNDYPKIGLSMSVAYLFKQKMLNDDKLAKASEMIDDLRAAFQELLDANSWMDDSTRDYAKLKADAMVVLEGFPEWLPDKTQLDDYYGKLVIQQNDHFGNVHRLRTFMHAKNLAGVARPRDQQEWTQSPLIVNAFYNGMNNRITFPAAIMNDPFFSGETVAALDYGRIGSIIGHEITHGFDNSGRSFDKEGTVNNWWTPATEKAFAEKEVCFVNQYSKYFIPEINQYVNGTTTRQENVADNGGLREAYQAFRRLRERDHIRGNARLPGLEKLSPDQLFFLSYATMWCRVETPAGLSEMQRDTHSPNRYRVIGTLSNMKEFSHAWECKANTPMNPADKCILW